MKKEYDFSRGRRGAVLRTPPGKTRITIRIDDDILQWFRDQVHTAGGGNYQTLINTALRGYLARKEDRLQDTLRNVLREELTLYNQKSSKYHLDSNQNEHLAGFAVHDIRPGEEGDILTRAFVHSDEPIFYEYISQISDVYLNKLGLLINEIVSFLILVNPDLSADIYVNDFRVFAKFRAKRDVKPGLIRINDIADIAELSFPDIPVAEGNSIVYCWKVGWKFGLYFDFRDPTGSDKLDVHKLQLSLGQYHNFLTFQNIYDSISNVSQFDRMVEDGWFPFLALVVSDYQDLNNIYKHPIDFDTRLHSWLSRFTKPRIESFVTYWWRKQLFAEKKTILEAGIEAFLQGTKSGDINCIKTLYSEVEGLLQCFFVTSLGRKLSFSELIEEVRKAGESRAPGPYSLGLPDAFAQYLRKSFFKNFNLVTGQISVSRHSVMHGVANEAQYNRIRALQGILILDQIYYYL